ncbi:MAG: aldehyde dehydrogenase family protein [Candidatus Aminicenantes bacterium]|jgi:succinate-semialdehyde dehydrogenase/glutarate-semialdehyde dehydrogenase
MDGKLIINNRRIETADKKKSINPATLETLGEFCLASSADCREAVQAAVSAFPGWSTLESKEKQAIFKRAKAILLERIEETAALVSKEKGSPFAESLISEIQAGGLEALDYYGRNLKKALRPRKAAHHVSFFAHKKSSFAFHPLGPTLIISPWNYPFVIPMTDILSALTAGNTVVLRPSTSTPYTALRIGEIFQEAGLPPGVLNVVNCRVPQAEEMLVNPDIQTIMFTGSTATGKRIMELASRNLTHIVLELGGKDPMIVLDDADLERTARGAVWGAFTNCGQVCSSIERAYVHHKVAGEFIERVVRLTKSLKIGDPLEPGTDVGPLTIPSQLDTVEDHIQDAKDKGAQVLFGGRRREDLPGYFFTPTVLAQVDHSMKIMTEETFGPVIPVMTFLNTEEAIRLANDSSYGLTASVWTRNRKKASSLADKLHAGTVTVNDHMFSFVEPGALWGGVKHSGFGRSHGPYGLLEMVNIKYISQDFSTKKTQLWWFPYRHDLPHMLGVAAKVFHHPRLKEKMRALPSLLPYLSRIHKGSPLGNYIKGLFRLMKK